MVTAPQSALESADVTRLQKRHFGEYARGELTPGRMACFGAACDVDGFRESNEVYALLNDKESISLGPVAAWDRARVAFYFALWYALSVVYSVKNKQAHIALALPLTIATAQVAVGAVVAAFLWVGRIRTPPKLSSTALKALLPIGLFHGIGHLTGVYATAVGSVSFVQVVKSAGPVWACLLSSLMLRQTSSRRVWLSLVPIVGGVGLASAQELSFVWAAFLASAASDVALALRNVLSKKSMDATKQAENMTPANTFYMFTILSAAFCVPLTGLEWKSAAAAWRAAAPTKAAATALLSLIVQSGLYFTAYSEVQFKALDSVSPVTHAVGNTMRRVVIKLAHRA
jgi:solute carrier family 35 protein E1